MNSKDVKVIDCDGKEEEEEDWLPPPPKNLDADSKSIGEDSTLKALRYSSNRCDLFSSFLKKCHCVSFVLSAGYVNKGDGSYFTSLNCDSCSSPTLLCYSV